jgi:FHA domain-containing protein
MRPMSSLERFLERLFERPSARLFRTRLQPVQLQRRIERAMETERLSGAERILVPNRFRVRLHPKDMTAFSDVAGSLASELADGALSFARAHRYAVADRPRVDLAADPAVSVGEIRVDARFADPEPRQRSTVEPGPATVEDDARSQDQPGRADAGQETRTMVFTAPVVDAPLAVLREVRPDGTQREVTVDGRLLTIGRAGENGLVLHDSRVSRHHARLQARRGTLVFTDLGSTNGSRVNGVPVDEVVLGEGDLIEVGDTVLLVESVGEA